MNQTLTEIIDCEKEWRTCWETHGFVQGEELPLTWPDNEKLAEEVQKHYVVDTYVLSAVMRELPDLFIRHREYLPSGAKFRQKLTNSQLKTRRDKKTGEEKPQPDYYGVQRCCRHWDFGRIQTGQHLPGFHMAYTLSCIDHPDEIDDKLKQIFDFLTQNLGLNPDDLEFTVRSNNAKHVRPISTDKPHKGYNADEYIQEFVNPYDFAAAWQRQGIRNEQIVEMDIDFPERCESRGLPLPKFEGVPITDVPPSKQRFDNFQRRGGPWIPGLGQLCGIQTEVFYKPLNNLEIMNIIYYTHAFSEVDGQLYELPIPVMEVVSGVERLEMATQGVANVFETERFNERYASLKWRYNDTAVRSIVSGGTVVAYLMLDGARVPRGNGDGKEQSQNNKRDGILKQLIKKMIRGGEHQAPYTPLTSLVPFLSAAEAGGVIRTELEQFSGEPLSQPLMLELCGLICEETDHYLESRTDALCGIKGRDICIISALEKSVENPYIPKAEVIKDILRISSLYGVSAEYVNRVYCNLIKVYVNFNKALYNMVLQQSLANAQHALDSMRAIPWAYLPENPEVCQAFLETQQEVGTLLSHCTISYPEMVDLNYKEVGFTKQLSSLDKKAATVAILVSCSNILEIPKERIIQSIERNWS
ncbi:hypothetical protein JXB41_05945 [Candidatus Woesearchaeota archaeon]|nr:hypothetical protein [Candidatus Woesearchaeota archaeon]